MKQSPFVISMLLAGSSAVKLERPQSNNFIGIQYDSKNGVYRYAMPGPTEDDARLAQSKTDQGMYDLSKQAIEAFSPVWDPVSEDQKSIQTAQKKKGENSKDVVGPNNVDPVQADYVNSHWFPEEGDAQFSYGSFLRRQAQKNSKDVVGPNNVDPVQAGYVNSHWFPEEGDAQFGYGSFLRTKANREKKTEDVVGSNNVDPVQAGYVNDHWFPEEGDAQFGYGSFVRTKANREKKSEDVVGPNNVDEYQKDFVNKNWFPEEGDAQFGYGSFIQKQKQDKSKAKAKDILGDDCVSDWQHGFVNDQMAAPLAGETYKSTAQMKTRDLGPDGLAVPGWQDGFVNGATGKDDVYDTSAYVQKQKNYVGPDGLAVPDWQQGFVNDAISKDDRTESYTYSQKPKYQTMAQKQDKGQGDGFVGPDKVAVENWQDGFVNDALAPQPNLGAAQIRSQHLAQKHDSGDGTLGPDGVPEWQPGFVNGAITSTASSSGNASQVKSKSLLQTGNGYAGDVYGNHGAGYSVWDLDFINGNITPETFPRSAEGPKSTEPPVVTEDLQIRQKDVAGGQFIGSDIQNFVNQNSDIYQAPRM